jgi:hypothetical protein
MGLGDAQRIINTIRQAIKQETKSGAKIDYVHGTVESETGNFANVYLAGNDVEPSHGFRVPAWLKVNTGDYVVCAIDYGSNLGKWISEVIPTSDYAKTAINPNEEGVIYVGDGSAPPEAIAVGSSSHPNLAAHDTLGLATQAELDAHIAVVGGTAGDHAHWVRIANDGQVATDVPSLYPGRMSIMFITANGIVNGFPTDQGTLLTTKGSTDSYAWQTWHPRASSTPYWRAWVLATSSWTAWNSPAGPTFVFNEIPSGTINGSNATFTVAYSPSPSSNLMLFKNGLLQLAGAGNDFTLSGATITFLSGNLPQTGDNLSCTYTH